MTDDDREREDALSPEAGRFIEQLKTAYEPRPMSAARRAALDARIQQRIERSPWPGWLGPGALAAAAAVAMVWVAGQRSDIGEGSADATLVANTEAAEVPGLDGWESQLYLYDASVDSAASQGVAQGLPPEYAAIDSLFFDS